MNEIVCLNPYDKQRSDAVNRMLKAIEQTLKDTIDVKKMVIMAMKNAEHGASPQGHWYKCKNKHYYYIGECGGAMQESRCPEPDCNSVIGGGGHRLAAGNMAAPEMRL
uniref:NFX1-type zinc finger-containing protein 1 n=1 Tax=Cacopsylla melanoneura TaxID=428564 RepID=A0A8D8VL27_9HEMI